MRRLVLSSLLVVGVSVLATSSLSADVRSDQRLKFQFAGALGKMINLFSKGAREGVTSMVAVRGDRKALMSGDSNGQIVDLAEEKVYNLDLKRKTYTVTTFAELRKQMEEAKRRADETAREMRQSEPQKKEKDPDAPEFEVDFDVKNTNETKSINGFDTKKTVITVTVREKGKTLNDSGGLVMTTDTWLAASAPSTKDLTDFDRKYAEKIRGPMVVGASPQDMAMAFSMYPGLKPVLDRMAAEGSKLQGTAILTDMRVEGVPPGTANQTSEALPPPEETKKKGGLGGMLGGLKKMAEASQNNQNSKPQRAIIMTTTVEMLKLTTDVDATSVAIPAGFKETK